MNKVQLVDQLTGIGLDRDAAQALADATAGAEHTTLKWSIGLLVAVWLGSTVYLSNKMDSNQRDITEVRERLARIETLLDERLPRQP